MTAAIDFDFTDDISAERLAAAEGAAVAFWKADKEGKPARNRSDKLALTRAVTSITAKALKGLDHAERLLSKGKAEAGAIVTLQAPHRMAAETALLVCAGAGPMDTATARRVGGKIAKALSGAKVEQAFIRIDGIEGDRNAIAAEIALGLRLMLYRFDTYKTAEAPKSLSKVVFAGVDPKAAKAAWAPLSALADGVETTRDLVNEPANVLTPAEFAKRAAELKKDKVQVEILREADLEKLGMRTLLAVGMGSAQESHVAIMRWEGASDKKAAPVCLVGKGVCFDTGGISLKPPAGMEEMTMDMGGAGVVVGTMKALARRKAKVNAIGIIGLVENMPSDRAQRPGDIVTSMSGKTVEVINTDAEGRLVLADLLWHAQETFNPRWMVNLATLTGAIIIALGHEKAGMFCNDDTLAQGLTDCAAHEGEGIWRMPLADAYDRQLKSRLADMKNVGGRPAGSITAAQFLQRFVKDGVPWAHLDIAGVTLTKEDGDTWRSGPSGWGVATLTRLVEQSFASRKG